MAQDRFIYWEKMPGPTRREARKVLQGFFDTAAAIHWNQDRWYVTLGGLWSHPFEEPAKRLGENRWIEVWPRPDHLAIPDCLDVLTRQADPFTSALANELVCIFARRWEGRIAE